VYGVGGARNGATTRIGGGTGHRQGSDDSTLDAVSAGEARATVTADGGVDGAADAAEPVTVIATTVIAEIDDARVAARRRGVRAFMIR